jgi:hypothetical protein
LCLSEAISLFIWVDAFDFTESHLSPGHRLGKALLLQFKFALKGESQTLYAHVNKTKKKKKEKRVKGSFGSGRLHHLFTNY